MTMIESPQSFVVSQECQKVAWQNVSCCINSLRCDHDPADLRNLGYPSESFRVHKEREIHNLCGDRAVRRILARWVQVDASGEFRAIGM